MAFESVALKTGASFFQGRPTGALVPVRAPSDQRASLQSMSPHCGQLAIAGNPHRKHPEPAGKKTARTGNTVSLLRSCVRPVALTPHSSLANLHPAEPGRPSSKSSVVCQASGESSMNSPESSAREVVAAAATAVVLGVTNRVLYKMALVPLSRYPFFLAQLTTFGYVLVYFIILWLRFRAGIVTPEMLAIPKRRFIAMGALEAMGLATGMAAATVLPGAMITVLSQSFLAWQLALSSIILGRRYTSQQLLGCSLVIAGVIAASIFSGSAPTAAAFQSSGMVWPAIYVLSALFPALSSIIKEGVFSDAAKRLKGTTLDIFVVNSFGSAFQAMFVFLLLPVLSRVGLRIPFAELPAYFREGAGCMLNMGTSNCEGAPLLPLLYIAANLAFNVSLLRLLKKSSAVVTSLSVSAAVPLTIVAFTLPLPFLGKPQRLGWGFFIGAVLLVSGLVVYNLSGVSSHAQRKKKAV